MPESTTELHSPLAVPQSSLPPPTTTPTPHLAMSASHAADILDLLDGLDADDFDFDDLDDLNDDDVVATSTPTAAPVVVGPPPRVGGVDPSRGIEIRPSQRTPSRSPEPHYHSPSPPPAEIPATVCFATARGNKIAEPSSAALKRAMKIIREAEKDVEIDERVSERGKRPRISNTPTPPPPDRPTSSFPAPSSQHLQATPAPPMALSLSADAYRTPVPVPDAARARALALFGETDEPGSPSAFRTAGGTAAPGFSVASRARVANLFASASQSEPSRSPERLPPMPASLSAIPSPQNSPGTSGFRTASGGSAPSLGPASRAQAFALFGEEPPSTSTGLSSDRALLAPGSQPGGGEPPRPSSPVSTPAAAFKQLLPSSTPRRAGSPAFIRPGRSLGSGLPPPLTPSRMPLYPMSQNATAGPSTPLSSVKLPNRIEIRTPGLTPRRIGMGLGTTPAGKRPRKGFSTPFKAPGVMSSTPKVGTPLGLRVSIAAPPAPPKPERIWEPVFDLKPRPQRISMREGYLYPGFYTAADLEQLGLPDEIWLISIENARYYQFIGEDCSALGTAQAVVHLKHERCELVTAKWVENHWALILWKIAGQIKARPTVGIFNDKWNWFEVICQLKYRYEREFGEAQRPIVRRIQEHDSSPSLPMVLCVSGIHHPKPVLNQKDEPVPQRPYLDLTDGWYHIRALTDDCLVRAIRTGKIKVGRKLGISGAKLESGGDGSDVLDAYEKSHLMLSGNSTHLARWDARLGTQGQPFVAGLTSLSVDGGPIVLMDVVIDKVFPMAFMNSDRTVDEAPWNEEEERGRVDAWKDKYEAESARLQEEMKKNLEKIEDLAATLASYAQDVSDPVSCEPPDSIDSDFDDLLDAASKVLMPRLRSLSSSSIVHLARHAVRRVETAVMEERAELECNLNELCPRREVRDFRMVRISDARPTMKEAKRSGLLNVWEASALGDGLMEGRRYMVTNLMPGRGGDWSPPNTGTTKEVYLHTRRDTRWKAVGASGNHEALGGIANESL